MRYLPLRPVPVDEDAGHLYQEWLASIDEALGEDCDRVELCRRVLADLFLPEQGALGSGGADALPEPGRRGSDPIGNRLLHAHLDPRNVTLEPEYYTETDPEKWARVKPLIWMWEMFDRSPLGINVDLGVRFRRILARRIFKRCGKNFKAFHQVKLSFGYNLEVGDDVVVHRHVLLDDRGGIEMGDRVSVSDYANIYSHTHDIVDPVEVATPKTIIGDGVRLAYHCTVLAGVTLAPNSMIGAGALVTRDTEPDTVYGGIPAKAIRRKPDKKRPAGIPDPLEE